jgi:hypothetical protein
VKGTKSVYGGSKSLPADGMGLGDRVATWLLMGLSNAHVSKASDTRVVLSCVCGVQYPGLSSMACSLLLPRALPCLVCIALPCVGSPLCACSL